MTATSRPTHSLKKSLRGASLTEFGMLAGLVAVTAIAAVSNVGGEISSIYCQGAKALGADLVCEVEQESSPAPNYDIGLGSGEFSDLVLPAGETRRQTVILPIEDTYSGTMTLRSIAAQGQVSSCVQKLSHEEASCSLPSSTSISTVDDPSYGAGYAIDPPADPRTAFTQQLTLQFYPSDKTPDAGKAWSINVTRPAGDIRIAQDFDFADHSFAPEETERRRVMIPMEGYSNSGMMLRIDPDNFVAACVQEVQGGPVSCGDYTSQIATIEVDQDAYAIGYEVNTGHEKFNSNFQSLGIGLESTLDSSVKRSWDISLRRDAATVSMNPTFTFSDRTLDAGDTQKRYFMAPMTGDFNGQMAFEVSYTGYYLAVAACIQKVENGPITCSSPSGNESVVIAQPGDYAVGYQTDPYSDAYANISTSVSIDFRSTHDSTQNHNYQFKIDRPGHPAVLNATFEIPDKHLAAGERNTGPFMYEMTGDYSDNMTITMDAAYPTQAKLCIQATAGGSIKCDHLTNGEGYDNISATTFAIGYDINWNYHGNSPINASFNIELKSRNDPSKKHSQSWTLTRPGQ
jgi:Flp pilus assembly pilin Flp